MTEIAGTPRSTIFEYDLQMFYVVFHVRGTKIENVELYRPDVAHNDHQGAMVVIPGPAINGMPRLEFTPLDGPGIRLQYTRYYDSNLDLRLPYCVWP